MNHRKLLMGVIIMSLSAFSPTRAARPATISLVNFPTLTADEPDRLNKTLKLMGRFIEQARLSDADLVVFPEICNHLGSGDDEATWAGEPLNGPTVTAISAEARKNGIYVVCPLVTIEGGKRYNSSVLIGRDGGIVGIYHKNFPTHPELDRGITPGIETPVFETDFGRVGLTICFDINYWEVGASICANKPELVIWSSMWEGDRMLTKWAIEFGFYMGACYADRSTITDLIGRPLISLNRGLYDLTGGASSPLVTATIDMDRRLLHHDSNLERLKPLFDKYGSTAIYAEWIRNECLLVIGSNLPDVSTDSLIREFGLETMRDYLARARRDRKRALEGTYHPSGD
ncbi:carbon-nitrogen hydrolase family protein [candidate division KSB1 bacterium]